MASKQRLISHFTEEQIGKQEGQKDSVSEDITPLTS